MASWLWGTAAPALAEGLAPRLAAQGWIALFDGETTMGWEAHQGSQWTVEAGTLRAAGGPVGLLATTVPFADFDLRMEFLANEDTNSGVFVRTPPSPQDPQSDCYEINIAPPENPYPTGSIVGREKAEVPHRDAWRPLRIVAKGPEIKVWVDGQVTVTYRDPRPIASGRIGLQHNRGTIAFREIRLLPLSSQSLFNGRDLSGWNPYPEMDSRWDVDANGNLHVSGGRGQLETTESYGDFLMQLDCRTNAKGLNSGVFFRCIPGDIMMGYEAQIQFEYHDGDRNRPVDCGTGGIFRRAPARRVVGDDLRWNTLTLIAYGPRIATWVNGDQVVDWVDTRTPHENPRKGLRTKPGTIMIQGHDPTTDLSFRNLRVVDYGRP